MFYMGKQKGWLKRRREVLRMRFEGTGSAPRCHVLVAVLWIEIRYLRWLGIEMGMAIMMQERCAAA